jgi:hypothetical protein
MERGAARIDAQSGAASHKTPISRWPTGPDLYQ